MHECFVVDGVDDVEVVVDDVAVLPPHPRAFWRGHSLKQISILEIILS